SAYNQPAQDLRLFLFHDADVNWNDDSVAIEIDIMTDAGEYRTLTLDIPIKSDAPAVYIPTPGSNWLYSTMFKVRNDDPSGLEMRLVNSSGVPYRKGDESTAVLNALARPNIVSAEFRAIRDSAELTLEVTLPEDVPDATLPDYSRIQAFVIPSSQSLASGNAIRGSVSAVDYGSGKSSVKIRFDENFTAGVEYQVAIINKNADLQTWSWRNYDRGYYPLSEFSAQITGGESAIEWIPQEYVLTVMSDRWKLVSQYRYYYGVGGAHVDFNGDYIPQNGFSDLDLRYGRISQKFSGILNGFLMTNKSSSLSGDLYLQISEEDGDIVEQILIQDDSLMKFSKQFLVASSPVIDWAEYYTGTMTAQANVADVSEYLAGRSWIYRMPY